LKILEDVRAGKVKVDREIDELTMALKNPEHRDGAGASGWYHGNLASRETLPPIEAADEEEEEESTKRRNGGTS
jgi:hypothetical protein